MPLYLTCSTTQTFVYQCFDCHLPTSTTSACQPATTTTVPENESGDGTRRGEWVAWHGGDDTFDVARRERHVRRGKEGTAHSMWQGGDDTFNVARRARRIQRGKDSGVSPTRYVFYWKLQLHALTELDHLQKTFQRRGPVMPFLLHRAQRGKERAVPPLPH
jgi:hypothetical protein